ncbi:hypothetical protein F2P79_012181 [Pimephales promelas]|nr:hypothetical protein F2P79_012181 [Pimephales promelas]
MASCRGRVCVGVCSLSRGRDPSERSRNRTRAEKQHHNSSNNSSDRDKHTHKHNQQHALTSGFFCSSRQKTRHCSRMQSDWIFMKLSRLFD